MSTDTLNDNTDLKTFLSVLKNHMDSDMEESEIPLDSSLEEIGIDSFKAVYLILDIEQAFDILIPEDIIAPEIFGSPQTLFNAIKELIKK
jgi:acyl carrier protein